MAPTRYNVSVTLRCLVSFLNIHHLGPDRQSTYSWVELATADTIEQPGVDSQGHGETQANVDDSQCVGFNRQAISFRRVVGYLTASVGKKQEQKRSNEFSKRGYHVMQDTVGEKAHDGTRVGKAKMALEVVSWVRHRDGNTQYWDIQRPGDAWLDF